VLADGQTDTPTHRKTQTDFIICPMLYAIAMGQIYRAITMLFLNCLRWYCYLLCGDVLGTNALQFGFGDNIGSSDAICTLRATLDHFVERESSVLIALLDIIKAFDRVNHYVLYTVSGKKGAT